MSPSKLKDSKGLHSDKVMKTQHGQLIAVIKFINSVDTTVCLSRLEQVFGTSAVHFETDGSAPYCTLLNTPETWRYRQL